MHYTISIRPSTGGIRKFAVTTKECVVRADWSSNRDIPCQSDQSWDVQVWQRISDRGYMCRLDGDGQWSNRGDHGTYIGTGATAEAALLDAWGRTQSDECGYDVDGPPRCLVAAARDYDCTVRPVAVE